MSACSCAESGSSQALRHDACVTEALEVGVGGYLLEAASTRTLADAGRAVAVGVFVLDKAVSRRLARGWRDGPTGPPGAGALTPSARDVLGVSARGLSNKYMAAQLSVGMPTVEGHASNLLAKLGAASRTDAVRYAVAHRLVDPGSHACPT